jgi:hypothetical protein
VSLTDPSTPNVEESKSEAETKETRVQKEETTDTLVNQIIVKEGKIAGLISAGRARSPFSGTMGAHTTAWSIKVDQVRRLLLKNETLDGAYGAIVKLAQTTVSGAAENVEKLKEQIEAYERKAKKPKQGGSTTDLDESDLMQKSNQLLGLQKAESEIVTWMSARRTFLSLQQLISALLRYQNFVPGATLEAADTGGKGEPHALEILGNPEQYAGEKIQWALVRTLDLSSENENQAVLLAKHLDSMKSQYNEAWSLSGMQRMTPEQRYEIALSAWETKDDSEFHPIKKRQKLKGTKAESKEKTIATTNQDRPKNTSRTPYTSGPGGLRSKL